MRSNRDDEISLVRIPTELLALILVFVTVGCAAPEDQESKPSEEQGTPVSTVEVSSRTLEETVEAVGSLRADQTVRISPEIAGRVKSVAFTEGDTVSRGDTLVQLDDDKLRQRYKSARYSLEEARATLRNARQTFERNKRLRDRDVISAQQFDDSRAAFESAQARVQRLEAQMEEARENLEDATIKAPFAGSIGSREIDAGNYVQPGTVLTTLYRLNPLEVRFTVPGRFAGRTRKGQSLKVHVNTLPDTPLTGLVFFVSPSIRERTRDLLVKGHIENPNRAAKPGAFARVELTLETRTDRPVIPSEALVGTTDGYIVFKVEDGTARRQPVKIGLRKTGLIEIREGIHEKDIIVRSGHQALSDGSQVKTTNGRN